jgi:hypothetical protein
MEIDASIAIQSKGGKLSCQRDNAFAKEIMH